MTTRTEQGTIAWVVSLTTFPYVAVPAYWVLGRRSRVMESGEFDRKPWWFRFGSRLARLLGPVL